MFADHPSDAFAPNPIELARRAAAAAGGYIDLAGSNPTEHGLLFPPEVLRAGADAYWAARRYAPDPRGLLPARESIAAYYWARTPPLAVTVDDLFVAASTSEAYSLLFGLLARPGDNVLAPAVTYPLFEYLAGFHHVELRPYRLDESRGWALDAADLRAQADGRTRAVLVVSPHNPTGHVLGAGGPGGHQALGALAALGLPVICDEVFADLPYAVPAVPPLGALVPDTPVVHLNGISKLFALPDLKLGWMALSGPAGWRRATAARLEVLNDAFLGASTLVQSLLPRLFAAGGAFRAGLRARVRTNLDHALARLAGSARLQVQAPAGGCYLFPALRPEAGADAAEVEEALVIALLGRGVLVHPGYFYDAPGAHLMISCLAEPREFAEGIGRLLAGLEPA
jgi:aspartate/methionine/tyrosine aminotransferase